MCDHAPTPMPFLLFHAPAAPRALHSFPTRRSSDLFESAQLLLLGAVHRGENDAVGSWALWTGSVREPTASFSPRDRKSTRLNSSHPSISYAVFCLKKKKLGVHIGVVLFITLVIVIV